jgi:hypothetical protein
MRAFATPATATTALTRTLAIAAVAAAASQAQALPVTPPAALTDWTCTGHCDTSAAQGDVGLSPLGSARHGLVSTADSLAFGVSPLVLDSNKTGGETNGSRSLSGVFSAQAGDTLDMAFNYISTDGKGFDDYGWARLLNAVDGSFVSWLFTARSTNSGPGKIVAGDVVERDAFDPDSKLLDFKDWRFQSKTAADPVNWAPLGTSNQSCWEDNAAGCGSTGWLLSRHAFAASGSYQVEVGVVNWGDTAYDSGLAFDYRGATAPLQVSPVPEPSTWALMAAGLLVVVGAARSRRPAAGAR